MKDIFTMLHDNDDDLEEIPAAGLTEAEKSGVLAYIRQQEAKERFAVQMAGKLDERSEKPMKKSTRWTATAAILAAALAVGGTVYAAMNWNRGIEESMQITDEQKQELESTGMAATAEQSCTMGGVTVTVDQCIVDNYYAYLSFNVTGYDLEDGAEPFFEETKITVDGEDITSGGGQFYDGMIMGSDGRAMYADGTTIDWDDPDAEVEEQYVQEDGSMQYLYTISMGDEKGSMIGKPIHVELTNLGTVSKAEFFQDVNETWTFDWTLPGSSESREYELDSELGDTGATVTYAELSPVSLLVECEFPRQEVTESYTDEEGETETFTYLQEPPSLTGVRLKDGTLLPWITNGGSMGYEDEETDVYMQRYAIDRVLDVDEVDALLFYKTGVESGETPTEDDFCIVPLGK